MIKFQPHRIEIFFGFLATLFIAAGLLFYAFQEPVRIEAAKAHQVTLDLDDAMSLYAENCAVCHGLAGAGIGSIPALDSAALRESDPGSLAKIISRGLYQTAMPAWSLEDGGPLSEYQIEQLVTLIQAGDWAAVQDRVVNLGLAPLVPFAVEADPELLNQVAALPDGEPLAQGITLYAEQCVACHGSDGAGTALAPALNDPGVRAKSLEELDRIIRLGVPGTLMAGWESVLPDEQIAAALALLIRWEEVPQGAIPAPEINLPVTEESLALGANLYSSTCARCHGPDGQGTPRAPSLNVKSFLKDTPDLAIQQIVTLGVPGTAMPAWGDRLTDAEIQAIVGFIRSWEPAAPEVAQIARGGGGPWWRTQGSMTNPAAPAGQNLAVPSSTPLPAEDGATLGLPTDSAPSSALPTATPLPAAQAQQHQGGPPWQQQPTTASSSWWSQVEPQAWILLGSFAAAALLLVGGGLAGLRRLL